MDAIERVMYGQHHDPFEVLGMHMLEDDLLVVRVFAPDARAITLVPTATVPKTKKAKKALAVADSAGHYQLVHSQNGMFEAVLAAGAVFTYELIYTFHDGHTLQSRDPYSFMPLVSDFDLQLLGEGNHHKLWEVLGANVRVHDGVMGVGFAVWAPNAERVSIVGNFNGWNGIRHPLRVRGGTGVWELFMPGMVVGEVYKFEIRSRDGRILEKADPLAFAAELRPATASKVQTLDFQWTDQAWIEKRSQSNDARKTPISIYEVHLGSWQRDEKGQWLNYREIGPKLADYVTEHGFTHIELMPVAEHPFDGSWGYQVIGYFAPTSRFGTPDDFAWFVNYMHERGIGVLLDWVPAHFPKDAHGLGRFDGSALYENADPRQGEHMDWGTFIFNYGRNEVRNFLIASAVFWLDRYHIDGLRVDAVASMLYLDFSRLAGQWVPNKYGGRENLEAIEFIKQLNQLSHQYHPGTLMFAEESTSFAGVTRPVYLGGLGFDFKWGMGWMNDSLKYIESNPIYRRWEHHKITFYAIYAYSENHTLPISHDEVVHGKKSMLDKMPGDFWQKFANLRTFFSYMWTMPGKKLLFMGQEFGQWREWSEARALDWELLEYEAHQGLSRLISALNHLYVNEPALHEGDNMPFGLEWLNANDADNSVYTYLRRAENGDAVVVLLNLTPVVRGNYHIGVPVAGLYVEIFNSDSAFFGGSNVGNAGAIMTSDETEYGRSHTLSVTLPPLGAVIFRVPKPAITEG
jgi:1,4-alpha-glucan branching enzyme